jgi:hypothetical protein
MKIAEIHPQSHWVLRVIDEDGRVGGLSLLRYDLFIDASYLPLLDESPILLYGQKKI